MSLGLRRPRFRETPEQGYGGPTVGVSPQTQGAPETTLFLGPRSASSFAQVSTDLLRAETASSKIACAAFTRRALWSSVIPVASTHPAMPISSSCKRTYSFIQSPLVFSDISRRMRASYLEVRSAPDNWSAVELAREGTRLGIFISVPSPVLYDARPQGRGPRQNQRRVRPRQPFGPRESEQRRVRQVTDHHARGAPVSGGSTPNHPFLTAPPKPEPGRQRSSRGTYEVGRRI